MSFAFKFFRSSNKGLIKKVMNRCLSINTTNVIQDNVPFINYKLINSNWIWQQSDPIKLPVSILPQIEPLKDVLWIPPITEPVLQNTVIDDPLNPNNEVKEAARLIIIRRKKMKKHKLKKLRKKLKYKRAKIRQRRELKKEKEFQAVLIAQCKEGEAFSAEQYVADKLKEFTKEPPIPFYLTDEYKKLVRWKELRLYQYVKK